MPPSTPQSSSWRSSSTRGQTGPVSFTGQRGRAIPICLLRCLNDKLCFSLQSFSVFMKKRFGFRGTLRVVYLIFVISDLLFRSMLQLPQPAGHGIELGYCWLLLHLVTIRTSSASSEERHVVPGLEASGSEGMGVDMMPFDQILKR